MLKMRVYHIISEMHEVASGPTYSVASICDGMAALGHHVTLCSLTAAVKSSGLYDIKVFKNLEMVGPLQLLGISRELNCALRRDVTYTDIFHAHSIWTLPGVYPVWASRGTSCKSIISTRGCLSPWAINHHGKRKWLAWNIYQRRTLQAVDLLHATAESEYQDIRNLGLRNPIMIVPNGIHISEKPKILTKEKKVRRLLFLSRIHPKKGGSDLLKAWARIYRQFPDWEVSIVGPDQGGHLAELVKLANELGLERYRFLPPVFGEEKSRCYYDSDLFILPTYDENFGNVVSEAQSFGLPVIVSKGAPWAGLEKEGSGWWIDIGVDSIEACLKKVLPLPQEKLKQMGEKGRQWMLRDYSWNVINQKMIEGYSWLKFGGQCPPWIQIN